MIVGIDIRHLATPNQSGIGNYTINLVQELAILAPETTFLLFASGTKKTIQHLPAFKQANIKIKTKKIPNRLLSLSMLLPGGPTLESFVDEKIDLWLFPNINLIKTRLPYAITVHDVSFKLFPHFFTKKMLLWHKIANIKRLLKNASVILAVSKKTKSDTIQQYKITPSKIKTTPLGVRPEFNIKTLPSDQHALKTYGISKPYILTLSTIEPRKNIESVIEAFEHWIIGKTTITKPSLVIAGGQGWKSNQLENKLSQKEKSTIHATGYINERHKPAILRHASVVIAPSFYEGFGLPLLEAMASGTPVITSHTSAIPETVQESAILINPYNSTDIVQALTQLEDPNLKSLLTERGIQQAKTFTWQKTAKKTFKAIQAIL